LASYQNTVIRELYGGGMPKAQYLDKARKTINFQSSLPIIYHN